MSEYVNSDFPAPTTAISATPASQTLNAVCPGACTVTLVQCSGNTVCCVVIAGISVRRTERVLAGHCCAASTTVVKSDHIEALAGKSLSKWDPLRFRGAVAHHEYNGPIARPDTSRLLQR